MKTIWFKTSLALTISAVSTYTLANGIAINEQSASGAGTAYAGRASSALDASTIYGNPAGLSKLKRTEVSGGLAIVKAKDDISQAHSTAQGSNKGDSVPLAAVPFGYFSTPINEISLSAWASTCPTASSTITKTASWAAPTAPIARCR